MGGRGWSIAPETSGWGAKTSSLRAGQVWCWGKNNDGQLGLGYTSEAGTTRPTAPVPFGGGRAAVALTVGDAQACAILHDTSTVCWGRNSHGELGYGDGDIAAAGVSQGNGNGSPPAESPSPSHRLLAAARKQARDAGRRAAVGPHSQLDVNTKVA